MNSAVWKRVGFGVRVSLVCLFLSAMRPLPLAGMEALDDAELEGISGQAGISIGMKDVSYFCNVRSLRYTATDGGSLGLNGVMVSGGDGGAAKLDAGAFDGNGDGVVEPVTLDLFTTADGTAPGGERGVLALRAPDWSHRRHFSVDNLLFCGTDLGRLSVGPVRSGSFSLHLAGHGSGVDLAYAFRKDIDRAAYLYNTAGDAFETTGIHFSASAAGDARDPSSWTFEGAFRVGDLLGEGGTGAAPNPARIDVGVDPESGKACLQLNLPMAGTVRMESIRMGQLDFGPSALDGIRVHRLDVRFLP